MYSSLFMSCGRSLPQNQRTLTGREYGEVDAWGPAVPWDFTLEHLWEPEKLSKYLSQGRCSLDRSDEAQLVWGLACAYRALCNTILERESFRAEVQAKGGSLQIKPDHSHEVPFSMSAAPVEGQKWKWVSSRSEQKEDAEEVEEDPGQGPSPKPPSLRKAMEKTKRRGEESEEEEVTVTITRPTLKMAEIQGSRKEFTCCPNKAVHLVASELGQWGQQCVSRW